MKKYFAVAFVAITAILLSSFNASTETTNGEKEGISNSEVWEHMRENVFKELRPLVNYKEEKMFSRCPSGFSQYMDEDKSDSDFVYGTITFAQGCDRDNFCQYKVDWNKKETYLKKSEKDSYVALSTFVKNEKKTAKI